MSSSFKSTDLHLSNHVQQPKLLLNKKDVARLLGVCVRTVNNLVNSGNLPPPIRFSQQTVRWRSEDIQTLCQSDSAAKESADVSVSGNEEASAKTVR